MNERERKAAETAMRRRRGARPEHAAKIKQTMLCQDDLFTTCRKCGGRVSGTLVTIQQHVEKCDGQRRTS